MTNVITEEEATKRWCPFVRMSNGPDGSWNRLVNSPGDYQSYNCLASECMAWRKVSADFDKDGNLPGYCGLAGAPGAPS